MGPTFQQLSGEQAIDEYLGLIASRPDLVAERSDLEVIVDRDRLLAHVAATGDALGLVMRSPYGLIVIDLVQSAGWAFPYIRFVSGTADHERPSGVVVVGVTPEGGLVLVRSLRHATGRVHWELPRGFIDRDEEAVDAGVRELLEETGYRGRDGVVLGQSHTDTGLSASLVAFVRLAVADQEPARPEVSESIAEVRVFPLDEVKNMIGEGRIQDGFAIQAVGLLHVLADR